ncbi:MAG: bifunctional transcriptional activator/DNA repair enzyme AdaA [Woeseiaceae bacterium]
MAHNDMTPKAMYRALLDRNPDHDGRWFVGVRTTGIFCRSICPARKPKFSNCVFYKTAARCLNEGFRPCQRCHPLKPAAEADSVIHDLLGRLHQDPGYRWSEQAIVDLGYDPSSVRRRFQRHFGMTFLALARQHRLGRAFTTLDKKATILEAQLEAGFDSPNGFRRAFAQLLGIKPNQLQQGSDLRADWIDSPLGPLVAVGDSTGVSLLEFVDRKALPSELKKLVNRYNNRVCIGRFQPVAQLADELGGFFAGNRESFHTPLHFNGSEFSQSVWRALQDIPAGETRSYAEIAESIGRRNAVRAVARANGANQLAIVVPCHRVIGSDGNLTGYGGGLWRKQKLIELELRYRNSTPQKEHS